LIVAGVSENAMSFATWLEVSPTSHHRFTATARTVVLSAYMMPWPHDTSRVTATTQIR
jgi:hypothetical protein